MQPQLSIIICSHNPRLDYLSKVIDALASQTLAQAHWELILIDNCSSNPLSESVDLSRFANARCIREDQLGLTAARLRGIEETTGDTLVFVDDDNVLAPHFLENALNVAAARPYIGAFGGNVVGEFESPVPSYARPHLRWLAIRSVEKDYWGNCGSELEGPVGAGLCLRRDVARQYTRELRDSLVRKSLDRSGTSLTSGGDIDMILTALSMGYGSGNFTSLSLTHLIPALRLEKAYLLRLADGIAFSVTLLGLIYKHPRPPEPPLKRKLLNGIRMILKSRFERKLAAAERTGTVRALRAFAGISS